MLVLRVLLMAVPLLLLIRSSCWCCCFERPARGLRFFAPRSRLALAPAPLPLPLAPAGRPRWRRARGHTHRVRGAPAAPAAQARRVAYRRDALSADAAHAVYGDALSFPPRARCRCAHAASPRCRALPAAAGQARAQRAAARALAVARRYLDLVCPNTMARWHDAAARASRGSAAAAAAHGSAWAGAWGGCLL